MSAQNVALLRMAGRLVDVSGRSGQAHFEEQIRGAWASALADIPRYLAADGALAERFADQLAASAGKSQHATLLFAMIDDGGKDTIVGEFFQNAEVEQLAQLGQNNSDILRLFARVSGGEGEELAEDAGLHAPLLEFGLASVPVPAGDPAAGSAVVTSTHVFPGAWEGPDSPGILRDLVRIHEALTRQGTRKPLARPGQPELKLWLASEPGANQESLGIAEARSVVTEVPVVVVPVAPAITKDELKREELQKDEPKAQPQPEAKQPEVTLPETKPEPKPEPAAKAAPTPHAEPVVKAEPKPEPAVRPEPVAKVAAPTPVTKVEVVTPRPEPVGAKHEPAVTSRSAALHPPSEKPKPKATPAPAFTATEAPSSGGMNRTLIIAGGGVAVVLAIGAYFLLGNSKPSSTPTPAPVSTSAPSQPVAAPTAAPVETARPSSMPPARTTTTATKAATESKTPAATPAATPASTPTANTANAASAAPAAATPDKRSAALDALGLDGQAKEDKKRDALKALTGQ